MIDNDTTPKVALCCKWDLTTHGVTGEEQNNIKLINYLETKYLIHEIFEDVSEWEDYESFYPTGELKSKGKKKRNAVRAHGKQ